MLYHKTNSTWPENEAWSFGCIIYCCSHFYIPVTTPVKYPISVSKRDKSKTARSDQLLWYYWQLWLDIERCSSASIVVTLCWYWQLCCNYESLYHWITIRQVSLDRWGCIWGLEMSHICHTMSKFQTNYRKWVVLQLNSLQKMKMFLGKRGYTTLLIL